MYVTHTLFVYYVNLHVRMYSELQINYPNLDALRVLVSGIPMPREGEDADDILITIAPPPHRSEPVIPEHWQSLLGTLSKLYGEGTKQQSLLLDTYLHFSIIIFKINFHDFLL